MRYYILKEIVKYLNDFHHIKSIKRVENNTVRVEFNNLEIIYFDLTKGNSLIYKKTNKEFSIKDYTAPFDVLLEKRFNNSKINRVYLKNDDKILSIEVQSKSSYKKLITILEFEFTGIYTNIIILDENGIVLEALRHIDSDMSSRIVKVGFELEGLIKPDFIPKIEKIDNISSFLENLYINKEKKNLDNIKKQKEKLINKQIKALSKTINSIESKEKLEILSDELYEKGNLILNNIHNIKPYQKEITILNNNFEEIVLKLDNNGESISQYTNNLFKKAKRAKSKAKNLHLEENNLNQKLEFLKRLKKTINNLNSLDELEFYFPKKQKNQTKTKKIENYQSFFINGYKIMLGRDERENIYLLQNSKASDFWFHLKDRNSSHVIVQNSKKTIPNEIIEVASKICAKFSVDFNGSYEVDFTQRRNIKIQNGANVLYNPYSTIKILI